MILDTDILIALLNGEPDANNTMKRLEKNGQRTITTMLNVYELLRGAYISAHPEKNIAEVQELLSNIEILDLTLQACEEASKIYRNHRKIGCAIGEFDTLIAAIAKTHAETVISRDEHFTLIQALNVQKW